jgi:hypothetical protein
MIEVRTTHALGAGEARRRIETLAREQGVDCAWSADGSATIQRAVPFLGRARAVIEVGASEVVVRVLEAPSAFGESTLRRWIGDALDRALA